ncbi:MAG TPA: hypothetical protein VFA45_08670 [Actinomycetes bacterium]|nr:hypothetical protein [Actinomycetes bacterium]
MVLPQREPVVVAGGEVARDPQPAVLLVTGADQDAAAREPVERLWQALSDGYRTAGRVALLLVPELPDAAAAARIDAAVTDWFGRHLTERE